MIATQEKVFNKILSNGLTVLVRPNHVLPKVSIQLWYNVGSKDEKSNEKGIAHLIEHMIFKGTKTLSESDINMITHKLSGYCNAFTSYDYTGYLFDFPSHHWQEALPIMADCMSNCTFKEELLASEMKAVIQELKMYRDDYASSLIEEMISSIFVDHPYHYPIIGFKQDLWSLKRETLINFYKKHYVPNNAVLVVVGDVMPEEVFAQAEKNFGSIKPNPDYKKETFYFSPDIISKSVIIYRDVKQPIVMLSWVVPGAESRTDYFLDVLAWILGLGKASRLYRLLVDELQLTTDVEAFCYDLFDQSLFFIYFQPKNNEDIEKIIDLITRELQTMREKGVSQEELLRATKQAQTQYLSLLERNQKQAYVIGQAYLATGDKEFLFNYLDHPLQEIEQKVNELLRNYFRSSLMHKGSVLPLAMEDKEYWEFIQQRSDQEDARILSKVQRIMPVEEGMQVHKVKIAKPKDFVFPRAEKNKLSNEVTVLSYHNPNVPKIELILSLQAKHYYDPIDQQGLNAFMCAMMVEGTKHYTGAELADAIESRGMSLSITPGQITLSMLKEDLQIGLDLLLEVLTNATFESYAISKVRSQVLADLKDYWDNPAAFVNQLARDQVYKNHPYSKKVLGDLDSVMSIAQNDLLKAYESFITPKNTILAIVGDIESYPILKLLENTLGTWQGPSLKPIEFPLLSPLKQEEIKYPIVRDQTVLCFAGLSVSRFDPRFDKLLLFDQIFSGGVLGSMSSRLFQLREQSGLFYTIGGSLLAHTDEQPGMVFIKTIVSLDRLAEAEEAIIETINKASTYIKEHELQEAKDALAHSMIDNFATNLHIASSFIFLEHFKLPEDYFDHRARYLAEIKAEPIMQAARSVLDTNHLIRIKVGRI
ncbi:MAG: pitrilysin family protein [Candidatus Babeliales bacterium]